MINWKASDWSMTEEEDKKTEVQGNWARKAG
jgi:hypothetical protein